MSTATTPDLLQSFLEEAWETVAVFEQTAEFLAIRRHEPLVVMAHRLKGSAGLYGFPQISNLGALAERILEAAPRYTEPQQAKVIDFMAQLTAVLINALENITIQGQEGRVGLELGRLGAAALLQELTALNPEAFANEDLEPPGNTPESAQPVGVVEELRSFYLQNSDFWEFFAPETLENLDRVTGALASLQRGGEHSEHLRILFRAMHTVKGAAYSVGCKPIGALAHQLEDLMVAVREGHRPWNNQVEHLISQGAQVLGQMIAAAEGKDPSAAQELDNKLFALQGQLAQLLGQAAPASPQAPTPAAVSSVQPARPSSTASVRVSLERLDALLWPAKPLQPAHAWSCWPSVSSRWISCWRPPVSGSCEPPPISRAVTSTHASPQHRRPGLPKPRAPWAKPYRSSLASSSLIATTTSTSWPALSRK
jgi:chemosensory pili system protein ChpA (sensor histidine kinase/response regulator)